MRWDWNCGRRFYSDVLCREAVGLASAHLLHGETSLPFAFCGMGLLMAAVIQEPFMAALMAVELTGQWHVLPVIDAMHSDCFVHCKCGLS